MPALDMNIFEQVDEGLLTRLFTKLALEHPGVQEFKVSESEIKAMADRVKRGEGFAFVFNSRMYTTISDLLKAAEKEPASKCPISMFVALALC